MDAIVSVSVLIAIPLLFGAFGFRLGRWKAPVAAAIALWTALVVLFLAAVAAADDVDPLWVLALGPLLMSAAASVAAPLLGAVIRNSMRD